MIKLKVSNYPCEVWLTDDPKAFERKYFKMTDKVCVVGQARGMAGYSEGRQNTLVGVFDGDTSTLVHELAHAVFNVMHYIGQPVNAEHSEVFCYLQDSLFSQANAWLNKKARREMKEDD